MRREGPTINFNHRRREYLEIDNRLRVVYITRTSDSYCTAVDWEVVKRDTGIIYIRRISFSFGSTEKCAKVDTFIFHFFPYKLRVVSFKYLEYTAIAYNNTRRFCTRLSTRRTIRRIISTSERLYIYTRHGIYRVGNGGEEENGDGRCIEGTEKPKKGSV